MSHVVEVDSAVEALWTRRRPLVLARLATLRDAADRLRRGELDERRRAEAMRVAHMLAGTLGTFGFPRASEHARDLELALGPDGVRAPGDAPALADLAAQLRDAIA